MINLQAKNLEVISQGDEPKIPIDTKTWDAVLKMVEIMPKLELFEKIANGEVVSEKAKLGRPSKKSEAIEETEIDETDTSSIISFEDRSKKVKERLNGKTAISTEKN